MKTLSSTLLSSFPSLTVAFTTREGGVSVAPYDSLNLAFHVQDNLQDVLQNHLILSHHLKYENKSLVYMSQIHSDKILVVDETMEFGAPFECDALITNCINKPLMVMSADCTPILIYDPIHHAIAAVHAGRAGALNSILPKTLHALTKQYGTSMKSVIVLLGPSIHGCCYEINETIAKEVDEKGYPLALSKKGEKLFLDVNTILLLQLEELGVQKSAIEVIDECTACHSDTYFSYRAHAQHTGRIAGVILLRPL